MWWSERMVMPEKGGLFKKHIALAFALLFIASVSLWPLNTESNDKAPVGTCESCHSIKWMKLSTDAPTEVPTDYEYLLSVTVTNPVKSSGYELRDVSASITFGGDVRHTLAAGETAIKTCPSTLKSGQSYTFTWKVKSPAAKGSSSIIVSVTGTAYYNHRDPTIPDSEVYTYTIEAQIKVGDVFKARAFTSEKTPPATTALLIIGLIIVILLTNDAGIIGKTEFEKLSLSGIRSFAFMGTGLVLSVVSLVYLALLLYNLPLHGTLSGLILAISGLVISILGFYNRYIITQPKEQYYNPEGSFDEAAYNKTIGKFETAAFYQVIASVVGLGVGIEHYLLFGLGLQYQIAGWYMSRLIGFLSFGLLIISILTGGLFKSITRHANRLFKKASGRVKFHCGISILLTALALYHGIVLILGFYSERWTTGLFSGLVSWFGMVSAGLTGMYQIQLSKKWGYKRWRAVHFMCNLVAFLVGLYHAVHNGTTLAPIREALPFI